MIKTLSSLLCVIMLVACSSTRKSYVATAQTVNIAMQEYADLVVAGHVSDKDQSNVRIAFSTYQAAMSVYGNALLSSDKNLLTNAINGVNASRQQLLDLLASFVKIPIK